MGRAEQDKLVFNYRTLDTYRKFDRTGLMYGRCLIVASMMETGMGLASNAVGTLYTAIVSVSTLAFSVEHANSLSLMFCRSEEHTSELQSLMRISYAVFCLK